MKKYLLIASSDPLESNAALEFYHLAINLVVLNTEVTLFLVQNGVFSVRGRFHSDALRRVSDAGVEVLADEFSLRERGIEPASLPSGIVLGGMDTVIDRLADGCTAMWH